MNTCVLFMYICVGVRIIHACICEDGLHVDFPFPLFSIKSSHMFWYVLAETYRNRLKDTENKWDNTRPYRNKTRLIKAQQT